jgi:hypothetical protein
MAASICDRTGLVHFLKRMAKRKCLDLPMRDFSAQRVAVIVVKVRYVFEVCWALGHQSAFAQKWHLGLWVEAVLSSEVVHVCQKLLSRDADEWVLDLACNVLGHGDNTLLAPVLFVGAAVVADAYTQRVIFELSLFGSTHGIVADRLSVCALSGSS